MVWACLLIIHRVYSGWCGERVVMLFMKTHGGTTLFPQVNCEPNNQWSRCLAKLHLPPKLPFKNKTSKLLNNGNGTAEQKRVPWSWTYQRICLSCINLMSSNSKWDSQIATSYKKKITLKSWALIAPKDLLLRAQYSCTVT